MFCYALWQMLCKDVHVSISRQITHAILHFTASTKRGGDQGRESHEGDWSLNLK